MSELNVLRAMYEVLNAANSEWLGMGDKPGEDLTYVMGVIDMTKELMKELSDEDSNSGIALEQGVEN